ncbi:BMA-CKI-2 [Dirofilaria immitis]|nr:BMA-CKI-2 [Dirofilaria immitis]
MRDCIWKDAETERTCDNSCERNLEEWTMHSRPPLLLLFYIFEMFTFCLLSIGTEWVMHTRSRRVSRCLFGKPDHEKLEKWLTKELEAIQIEREKGYGFDFKNDQPIPSTAYIVEAVPESTIFYRTTYYPSKERSKKLTFSIDCTKQKFAGNGDVVAYHTRSHDTDASKLNLTFPKISESHGKIASQSRSGKIQRLPPLKTRGVHKISRKSGLRKKSMKQSLLTNYLPVVRKRRSLTRSEYNESSKLSSGIHEEMDSLSTKVFDPSSTGVVFSILLFESILTINEQRQFSDGVRTRWQSRKYVDLSSRSPRCAF